MTSSPCSAAARPERRAPARLPVLALLIAALPLALAAAPVRGQPQGAPAAAPPAELGGLKLPQCPHFKELCVNAERTGVFDLKTGIAELEGNVTGYMESQEMAFHADLLRAFRNGDGEWRRLLLSSQVKMAQADRMVTADHGVIEKETALFYGHARMTQDTAISESDEVLLEHDTERATLKGTPVHMEFTQAQGAGAQMAAAPGGAAQEAPPPQPTRAFALKAVVEENSKQVTLSGRVDVDIPSKEVHLTAESVVLQFGDDDQVSGFTARGDVVITQPGRRLTADSARSQNRMQTILLQGRARAQQEGQFDLNSDRMEVFTDPKRGQVRSEDRQRPISTSLDLAGAKPYKLEAAKLQVLANQGVPPATLLKLDPIVGKSYGNQEAFRKAVNNVISADESRNYLSTILAQAH